MNVITSRCDTLGARLPETQRPRHLRRGLSIHYESLQIEGIEDLSLRLGQIRFVFEIFHVRILLSFRSRRMKTIFPQHLIEVGSVPAGKLRGTGNISAR